MKENKFREKTSDIIANPRELDQAVTFLHENGENGEGGEFWIGMVSGEGGRVGSGVYYCGL